MMKKSIVGYMLVTGVLVHLKVNCYSRKKTVAK